MLKNNEFKYYRTQQVPQADRIKLFGICEIMKFIVPYWLCCSVVFVNVSFVISKNCLINLAELLWAAPY